MRYPHSADDYKFKLYRQIRSIKIESKIESKTETKTENK